MFFILLGGASGSNPAGAFHAYDEDSLAWIVSARQSGDYSKLETTYQTEEIPLHILC